MISPRRQNCGNCMHYEPGIPGDGDVSEDTLGECIIDRKHPEVKYEGEKCRHWEEFEE